MQKLTISLVVFFIILFVVILHKYIISSYTLIKLRMKSESFVNDLSKNSNKLLEMNNILESARPTVKDAVSELRLTVLRAAAVDCENILSASQNKLSVYNLNLDNIKHIGDYYNIMSLNKAADDMELQISKMNNIINEHYINIYNL